MRNNGKNILDTKPKPFSSMPLIQNHMRLAKPTNVTRVRRYDEREEPTCCGYHIKYFALVFTVLLCLEQISSWCLNIFFLRGYIILYFYDVWNIVFISCFIVAQISQISGFMWPIRVHFFLRCVLLGVWTISSASLAIHLAFVDADSLARIKNELPDIFRLMGYSKLNKSFIEPIVSAPSFAALAVVFFFIFTVTFIFYKIVVKFHHYLIDLHRTRTKSYNPSDDLEFV